MTAQTIHDELIAKYLHLTNHELPTRARTGNWVVRENHCFQRILLDNIVGDAWRNVLRARLPAYRQLSDEQLNEAVQLAWRIAVEGDKLLRELNKKSLAWRGKLRS